MGAYMRFVFVNDEKLKEILDEDGILSFEETKSMDYDDICERLEDMGSSIEEWLDDERCACWLAFFEAKLWAVEDYALNPLMPPVYRIGINVEWVPDHYIWGHAIDGFMKMMEELLVKMKERRDELDDCDEKDFFNYEIKTFERDLKRARQAIKDGFNSRVIPGWA